MNDNRIPIREVFPAIKLASTVTIILSDTGDGMVDVQTTIQNFSQDSNAVAMAHQMDKIMTEIATQEQGGKPNLKLVVPAALGMQ